MTLVLIFEVHGLLDEIHTGMAGTLNLGNTINFFATDVHDSTAFGHGIQFCPGYHIWACHNWIQSAGWHRTHCERWPAQSRQGSRLLLSHFALWCLQRNELVLLKCTVILSLIIGPLIPQIYYFISIFLYTSRLYSFDPQEPTKLVNNSPAMQYHGL